MDNKKQITWGELKNILSQNNISDDSIVMEYTTDTEVYYNKNQEYSNMNIRIGLLVEFKSIVTGEIIKPK